MPAKRTLHPEGRSPLSLSADNVAWYALLTLVALVPLATTNLGSLGLESRLTYSQYDLPKMVIERLAILVGFTAWAWGVAMGRTRLRWTWMDPLVVALLIWTSLSAGFAEHVGLALLGGRGRYDGLLTILVYASTYFLTIQLVDRAQRVVAVARTFFWPATMVAAGGVAQYLGLDRTDWSAMSFEAHRAFATYGNPDLLAGFLCLSFPVAAGLVILERRAAWRWVYAVGLALQSTALFATFVRGAWIGAAVGAVALAVLLWRQKVATDRFTWGAFAGSGLAVAAAAALSMRSTDAVTNALARAASITETSAGSAYTRLELWRSALAAIAQRPVFGWGPDSFSLAFAHTKTVDYVSAAGYLATADNAHDYPLQLAATLGIPGALLAYAVFAGVAVLSGRELLKPRTDRAATVLAALWAGCSAYLAYLSFGISTVGSTVFLWLFMGLLMAPTARSLRFAPRPVLRVAATAITAIALIGIATQWRGVRADRAYLESMQTSGVTAVRAAEKAVRLNPFNPTYTDRVAWAKTLLFIELVSQRDQAIATGLSEQANVVERAARTLLPDAEHAFEVAIADTAVGGDNRYAQLANLYLVAAQSLGDTGYADKALNAADAAITSEPTSMEAHYLRAYVLDLEGKTDEAIAEARTVHRVSPDYVDATILLARTLAKTGEADDASALLSDAERRDPHNPGLADAREAIAASSSPLP